MIEHSDQLSGPEHARRPLGLSVALAATALLYGIAPLLEVYFIRRLSLATSEAFLLGGADVSEWVWIEGSVGGVILLLCVLAWWGRLPWVRHVLVFAILLITAVNLYRIVDAAGSSSDILYNSQARSVLRGWLVCQLPGLILIPLYTAWYLNRAPSRAFYRRAPRAPVRIGPAPTGSRSHET